MNVHNIDAQLMSKFGLVVKKTIMLLLLFSSGSNIDIKYLRHTPRPPHDSSWEK